ncbi:ABC transporter permease [Odoribacter sp. Z80]|uniref:cell division protein FtsX n=1 Tax=Odoribacter sp. Z80 TaxID=2304575 RepID=UPI00137ADDBF|nr:permease-like cell division protein FtsX [Odoribacter sp. Z80]NCE71811.1 ABC transporter permease [Odoribacter sp. Z80]
MAAKGKKRVAGSYFVSTLSISLVLVVIGILVFILLNARQVSDHVKQNIGFSIIVKDDVNEAEIKKMQKILDTKPFVSSSVFISKDEAARTFKKELGEDFEEVLGYNPLLPSVEIKLNPVYANNDSLAVIEKILLKNEVIQEVSYQKSLVHMINENVRRISIILLIAGAALMLISFTLIRNTIHLAVYSQRFLIKTMQLVGAKPFFICKPFIQNGIWFGFFGSMFANLVLLAAVFFLQKEVGGVIDFMNKELLVVMVLAVMVCGILLSLLSAWMSVNRYLKKDMNDLYN